MAEHQQAIAMRAAGHFLRWIEQQIALWCSLP
jgi:hypothetical protein